MPVAATPYDAIYKIPMPVNITNNAVITVAKLAKTIAFDMAFLIFCIVANTPTKALRGITIANKPRTPSNAFLAFAPITLNMANDVDIDKSNTDNAAADPSTDLIGKLDNIYNTLANKPTTTLIAITEPIAA